MRKLNPVFTHEDLLDLIALVEEGVATDRSIGQCLRKIVTGSVYYRKIEQQEEAVRAA